MSILGFKTINLTATSTAKWGASRLRVALVLDTTGSMASDGKIAALITATKNLLGQLQSAASVDGDVYVSIIPFAKDVRIENNYDATWDDWIYWDNQAKSDPNSWDATHGKCNTSGSILLRSNCVSACSLSNYTTQSTCTAAGTCSISGNSTQSTCTNAGTCSISGKTSQSTCTSAGTCSISGYSSKSACNSAGVCSLSQWTTQSKCSQKGGTWTFGVWTAGVWTAGVWTPGVWTVGVWTPDLLSRKSWSGCTTDRGPLPPTKPPSGGNAYRPNRQAAEPERRHIQIPAGRQSHLPAGDDGAQLQLVGNESAGRQPWHQRQHQSTHRAGVGLAITRRWRALHRAGEGLPAINMSMQSSCCRTG